MAEETENNKITLNLDFEPIIPWNGQRDTGRDVRLKLDRNLQKVVDAFNALISFMVTIILTFWHRDGRYRRHNL